MSKQNELVQFSRGASGGGSKNVIVNGAMNVAQRSTSVTGIGASDGYFTVDRFKIDVDAASAGRLTMSQHSDGPSGFANCIKLDCTTADTSIAAGERLILRHIIEGQDLQQLKKGTSDAKSFTISFYVKGNAAATYSLSLYDGDNGRTISQTFSVTTSWNRIELTFAGDTTGAFGDDNGASLYLDIFLHAGSSYTSGTLGTSWAANNNATRAVGISSFFDSTNREFFITGYQMEANDNATDFEYENYGTTLAKCQRYYQKQTAGTNQYSIFLIGSVDNTSNVYMYGKLNGTMRTSPSFATANTYLYTKPDNTVTYSSTANRSGPEVATINFSTLSGGTVGNGIRFESNAGNGYVEYNAEL